MRTELSWKKRITRWVIAAVLLLAGWAFTLVGEELFGALGLPVWSEGDRGWNYVGVSAFVIFAVGISVFNSTLSEKVRYWIWAAVVVVYFLLTCN